MAGKNWFVLSPVRLRGKLYPTGSKLQASKDEVVGLEHCLSDKKAPDDDTIAENEAAAAAEEAEAKAAAEAEAEAAAAESLKENGEGNQGEGAGDETPPGE